MSCEICPIIQYPSTSEQQLRLYEGAYWRATLRQDQSLLGTYFITAKRHVGSLGELSAEEWQEFGQINSQLEYAVKCAFGAEVINTACLMNLAFQQDNPEPHVHWHNKPRYASPVHYEGYTFTDPAFGEYLDGRHKRFKAPQKLLLKIAQAILSHAKD